MPYNAKRLPTPSLPLLKMFWSQVAIGEPNDCWLWTGKLDTGGYGRADIRRPLITVSQSYKAHRLAYWFTYGVMPGHEQLILHCPYNCKHKNCCNPLHLRIGTQRDNMADLNFAKRRNCWGRQRLSHDIAKQIRVAYGDGSIITQKELAQQFNCSPSNIRSIINNKTFVDGDYTPPHKPNHKPLILSYEQACEIRRLYHSSDISGSDLARKHHISESHLREILNNTVERYFDPFYIRSRYPRR